MMKKLFSDYEPQQLRNIRTQLIGTMTRVRKLECMTEMLPRFKQSLEQLEAMMVEKGVPFVISPLLLHKVNA